MAVGVRDEGRDRGGSCEGLRENRRVGSVVWVRAEVCGRGEG